MCGQTFEQQPPKIKPNVKPHETSIGSAELTMIPAMAIALDTVIPPFGSIPGLAFFSSIGAALISLVPRVTVLLETVGIDRRRLLVAMGVVISEEAATVALDLRCLVMVGRNL